MKPLHALVFQLLIALIITSRFPGSGRAQTAGGPGHGHVGRDQQAGGRGRVVSFFSRSDKGVAPRPTISEVDREGIFRANSPPVPMPGSLRPRDSEPCRAAQRSVQASRSSWPQYLPAQTGGTDRQDRGRQRRTGRRGSHCADKFTTRQPEPTVASASADWIPTATSRPCPKPGWVLEKNSYHYLSPGEKKELGDLVIRRAAT